MPKPTLTRRIRSVLKMHGVESASLEKDLLDMACKWREEVGSNGRQRFLTNTLGVKRVQSVLRSRGLLKQDEYVTSDPIQIAVTHKRVGEPDRHINNYKLDYFLWED